MAEPGSKRKEVGMNKLAVFALPVLALAAACAPSHSVDDEETTESSVTVTPGEGTATVTLHMPAGYDANVPSMGAHFELSVNGTVVIPEKPTKVSWNTGGTTPSTCITGALKNAQGTIASMRDCSTTPLQKNETRTIAMSVLKLWWSNYPQVWADYVSHYATEKVTLTNELGGEGWYSGSNDAYAFLGTNGIAMPVAAGTYRYQIGEGAFKPLRFAVAAGTVADVNVGYDAYNSMIDFAFEDREGFPTAPKPMLWLGCLYDDTRAFARPDGATTQTTTILDWSAGSCELTAGGFKQDVAHAPGTRTSVKLHRLNVDHVTLADGSKSHGFYQVARKRDPSAPLGATPPALPWNPTGTGLDLPSGEYVLDIRYADWSRQQLQDVDFR
jgi:hypothetical protein